MNDLPTRLRRWTHDVDAAPASELMDDAAAELEQLRWRVKTLESAAKNAARARPTLTDEEREAVEYGRELIREWHAGEDPKKRDVILCGLLERMKHNE